ncbi:type I addiction module toxin, SymE family [Serratia fonticola]|nr:SymE family type I addiction module toxin [Serratia fonticola]MBC3216352.1 type I addiction module toxin, SymE family [Serratia fonticola]
MGISPNELHDWIRDNGELYRAGDWLTQFGLTGQPLTISAGGSGLTELYVH